MQQSYIIRPLTSLCQLSGLWQWWIFFWRGGVFLGSHGASWTYGTKKIRSTYDRLNGTPCPGKELRNLLMWLTSACLRSKRLTDIRQEDSLKKGKKILLENGCSKVGTILDVIRIKMVPWTNFSIIDD